MPASDDARIQVLLEANIDKLVERLNKATSVIGGWAANTQHRLDDADSRWDRLFGKSDPGKAFEKLFDSTRLKILDTGIARVGLVGTAFEDLGASGIAAAAAIGIAAVSITQALKSSEWAEKLSQTADKLGLTKTQAQELQFALASLGKSPEQANGELERLNQVLGQLQSNEPRSKILLKELGFTPEQIRSFSTVAQFIPALAEHIKNLGNAAEAANILEKMGVPDWQPLLMKGAAGFDELTKAAHDTGVVLDADFVKAASKANEQMHEAQAVLDGSLHRAFIGLVPAIVTVVNALTPLAQKLADIIEGFKELDQRSTGALQRRRAELVQQQAQQIEAANKPPGIISDALDATTNLIRRGFPFALPFSAGVTGPAQRRSALATTGREISDIDALLAGRAATPEVQPGKPPKALVPNKPGPASQNAEELARADKDILEATKAELAARVAMVTDIAAQAELQKQEIDADTEVKNASLEEQVARIDRLVKEKKMTANAAESAKTEITIAELINIEAGEEKKQLIERQKVTALIAERLKLESELNGFAISVLQSAEGEARTAKERQVIALAILKIQQDELSAALQEENRQRLERAKTSGNPATVAAAQAQNDQLTSAQAKVFAAQQHATIMANLGPLDEWKRATLDTAAQVNEAYQNVAVEGLNSVTDGIVAAITQTKSLGAAFHDIATQIIADLVRIGVQQSITRPLANLLFGGGGLFGGLLGGATDAFGSTALTHLAGGTMSSRGGLTVVGENGPELLNLRPGSQVVNSALLSQLMNMSDQGGYNAGPAPQMTLAVTVNAQNAVLTDAVRGWVADGVRQAISVSGSQVPSIVNNGIKRRVIKG